MTTTARTTAQPLSRRRWRVTFAGLAAAVLVAACGGGDTIEPFEPTRLFAFGDETSVITSGGLKYSVNALDDEGDIACDSSRLWVQSLARNFGLVFAECNPDAVTPRATMRATPSAKVADVATAVGSFLSNDAPADKDLVTMLAGMHDILELYRQYPTLSAAAIDAELEARGAALAAQVNRVAQAGPRVVVVTVPNLGLTPYAVAEKAAHPGDTGALARDKLLTRFTKTFNLAMRIALINDGRMIGLVDGQAETGNLHDFPGSFGLTNVTTPVCLNATAAPDPDPSALLQCTNDDADLVAGADPTDYLFADNLRFGAVGHSRLASVAISIARNNPF